MSIFTGLLCLVPNILLRIVWENKLLTVTLPSLPWWTRSLVPILPSWNEALIIAVKKHAKLHNKFLKSCPILLDFFALRPIFCSDCSYFIQEPLTEKWSDYTKKTLKLVYLNFKGKFWLSPQIRNKEFQFKSSALYSIMDKNKSNSRNPKTMTYGNGSISFLHLKSSQSHLKKKKSVNL